jgi:hypothetical protein
MTAEDAKFLTGCADWSVRQRALSGVDNTEELFKENPFKCLPFALDDGRRAGKYHGTDQLESCAPELVRRAAKMRREFVRTEACPRSIENYAELKARALQLIRAGYDTTRTPTPGATLTMCAYNEDQRQFYSDYHGRFLDPLLFLDSGSAHAPIGCAKMWRSSKQDQIYKLREMTCNGDRDYRDRRGGGGEVGDVRFIPVIDKVWLQVVTQEALQPGERGKLYMVGWVFEL